MDGANGSAAHIISKRRDASIALERFLAPEMHKAAAKREGEWA
jgi:hypothetical protein